MQALGPEASFVEAGATSFMSMFRTMDRSTITILRENTAERLASTVQVRLSLLALCIQWRWPQDVAVYRGTRALPVHGYATPPA